MSGVRERGGGYISVGDGHNIIQLIASDACADKLLYKFPLVHFDTSSTSMQSSRIYIIT